LFLLPPDLLCDNLIISVVPIWIFLLKNDLTYEEGLRKARS
jgi:hypothetical protein